MTGESSFMAGREPLRASEFEPSPALSNTNAGDLPSYRGNTMADLDSNAPASNVTTRQLWEGILAWFGRWTEEDVDTPPDDRGSE